jgi:hypothetical protein
VIEAVLSWWRFLFKKFPSFYLLHFDSLIKNGYFFCNLEIQVMIVGKLTERLLKGLLLKLFFLSCLITAATRDMKTLVSLFNHSSLYGVHVVVALWESGFRSHNTKASFGGW